MAKITIEPDEPGCGMMILALIVLIVIICAIVQSIFPK
jgi:hypothetical protein